MQDTQTLLSITRLKKHFPLPRTSLFRPRPYLRAVDGVTLDIKKGETLGLVGESGSGKSTLGRTVLQLYSATEGSVRYFGREREIELTKVKPKDLRALRKDLQIIFQDPYSSLNPRMTVGQIIGEGVFTHKLSLKGDALREYVLSVMKDCGLQEYALHRYPHQFSGGQRQRICIARALALKPKFVVCDECVSALDVSIQSQILNLLSDLKEKEGLTYLFISHDLSVVRHISDRIAVLYLGKIVEIGEAEEVFSAPRHPYTVALVSAIPSIEGEKEGKDRIFLPNNPPSGALPSGCPFHPRCFMAQECCKKGEVPMEKVGEGHFVACHFARIPTKEKEDIAKKRKDI